MQDAVEAATVGAAFLDPLTMRNNTTLSANREIREKEAVGLFPSGKQVRVPF